MQVAIHFGTHGTEPERMIRTLMENRDWLLANGVEVVPPGRYKGVLDEALNSLKGGDAPAEMEEVIYDAMLESESAQRMVISQASLIGAPVRCLSEKGLFPQAGTRMRAVAGLFPSAEVEVSLAIQNPALQIPHLASRVPDGSVERLLKGCDPRQLRWGPAMQRIIEAMQGRRVIVWCYEDTPLIWPEVVRRIARMPADVPLKSGLAVLGDLLPPEGMADLKEAMTRAAPLTVEARRRIFAEMLGRHARADLVRETVTVPGWTQDLVDEITDAYEEDVGRIAALPGVEFLSP
ncbi:MULTISPECIES: hypothetical protein [unclassified Paracoccus (in: a-proteobacteria)]|uniref:hypothetical protein n=1 Tax=unclassified Paracoccus (in: a-proteobacteria) TaxID=2688777 RepID=UPI0016004BF1|nr:MULTISPECIES: hypothetical protein [unclassified Paracoccus (in: a-proteobacteria)]MBB1492363.1 hypothetical protein [Paracoccus sp. MC1854]MBB1496810.1 hypothetical protein [Paracoccus sp. MC1862]QQO45442.1 hypothetical protein JGR78_03535 [Paracoccus sp. MC1862]